MTLRIATRRSALAQAQTAQTGWLITARTGEPVELVPMATTGDLHPDRPVGAFETKGLFVDALRRALLDGDCDLAVHSYKDLPTEPVEGVVVGAVPPREDPRDVLISRAGGSGRGPGGYALSTLPGTAIVGTSSQRRRLELLRARPSLQILPLRGNLDTRLGKVADGEFDAVVVAFAGLRRLYADTPLGLPLTAAPLEPGECLPAPGQGALAIKCRSDDDRALAVCEAVDEGDAHHAVRAERAFLRRLGGGCLAPVGALGTVLADGRLELLGMLACPVTRKVVRRSLRGPRHEPDVLGAQLAEDIDEAGGAAMLQVITDLRAEREAAQSAS